MEAVVLIIKLKPGWALDARGSSFRRGARRLRLLLPPGSHLEPALPLPAVVHPTEAERELRRYVQLHHPGPADAALALAQGWWCVERAALR